LLLFTVIIIYMVLAVLYEHLGHPLTILTALPLAGFGALLVLLLMDEELNIFSFVGIILLVGLVKKNGIMMIDFALTRQRAGMSAEDAIVEACLVRLRPIMMTTLATIFATLPIAIGFGAGGEARRPLGIAVVGGMVFSQFLTLYITPTFYVSMARMEASSLPVWWRWPKSATRRSCSPFCSPRNSASRCPSFSASSSPRWRTTAWPVHSAPGSPRCFRPKFCAGCWVCRSSRWLCGS
jgi:hypothetical protein